MSNYKKLIFSMFEKIPEDEYNKWIEEASCLDDADNIYPNLYFLGKSGGRVTVYSQQTRAFRLAHALYKTGQLKALSEVEDERILIAIIGGGVSGCTFAYAISAIWEKHFSTKRLTITIYERTVTTLNKLDGNRLLHPHIYEWPHFNSQNKNAGFPFMNWQENSATNVQSTLKSAFDSRLKSLQDMQHIEHEIEITDTEAEQDINNITYQKDNKQCWEIMPPDKKEKPDTFHMLTVATGFGTENIIPDSGTPKYWETTIPKARTDASESYLICSGNGDGGLTDFFIAMKKYSSNKDMTQSKIIENFHSYVKNNPEIGKKILEIEAKYKDGDFYELYEKNNLSEYIQLYVNSVKTKKPVRIFLATRGKNMLVGDSSIIARVIVYAMIKAVGGKEKCHIPQIGTHNTTADFLLKAQEYNKTHRLIDSNFNVNNTTLWTKHGPCKNHDNWLVQCFPRYQSIIDKQKNTQPKNIKPIFLHPDTFLFFESLRQSSALNNSVIFYCDEVSHKIVISSALSKENLVNLGVTTDIYVKFKPHQQKELALLITRLVRSSPVKKILYINLDVLEDWEKLFEEYEWDIKQIRTYDNKEICYYPTEWIATNTALLNQKMNEIFLSEVNKYMELILTEQYYFKPHDTEYFFKENSQITAQLLSKWHVLKKHFDQNSDVLEHFLKIHCGWDNIYPTFNEEEAKKTCCSMLFLMIVAECIDLNLLPTLHEKNKNIFDDTTLKDGVVTTAQKKNGRSFGNWSQDDFLQADMGYIIILSSVSYIKILTTCTIDQYNLPSTKFKYIDEYQRDMPMIINSTDELFSTLTTDDN